MKKLQRVIGILILLLIVFSGLYFILNEKIVITGSNFGHQLRVNHLGLNCYSWDWGWKKINKTSLRVDKSTITYVGVASKTNSDMDKRNSFFNGDYLKDRKNVYYVNVDCVENIVTNADPSTFTNLGFSYGKDKSNIFFAGKHIPVDYSSFMVLPEGVYFAVDNTSAYYAGTKISGADINTFHPIARQVSADKNCIYFEGRKETDKSGKCVDPNIVKKYCGVNIKEEDCWGSLLDYLIRIQQNLPVVHQNN
jgi:hypothetical protein